MKKMLKNKKIDNKRIPKQVLTAGFFTTVYILYLTFRIKPILVISNSIARYAPQGSIVFIMKSTTYRIGDVITFKFKNVSSNLITHRVKNIKEIGDVKLLYTKGDSNSFNDPIPVSEDEIIGKVFLVVPYVGKIVSLIFIPWVLYILYYVPAGFCFGSLFSAKKRGDSGL